MCADGSGAAAAHRPAAVRGGARWQHRLGGGGSGAVAAQAGTECRSGRKKSDEREPERLPLPPTPLAPLQTSRPSCWRCTASWRCSCRSCWRCWRTSPAGGLARWGMVEFLAEGSTAGHQQPQAGLKRNRRSKDPTALTSFDSAAPPPPCFCSPPLPFPHNDNRWRTRRRCCATCSTCAT